MSDDTTASTTETTPVRDPEWESYDEAQRLGELWARTGGPR